MSGRKYTQAELANNLREAIHCCLAAERTCDRAQSLVASLEQATQIASALQPWAEQARQTLVQSHVELDALHACLKEDRLISISLEEVRAKRSRIDALLATLDETVRRCREGSLAAAMRSEIAQVALQLTQARDSIEPWSRDTYADFSMETSRLLDDADKELRRHGNLNAVADRIQMQVTAFQAMLRLVDERRRLGAERQYIAEALEKVCREELGFTVRRLPQNNPVDDLVLEVDTFAWGLIHFRLQLNGAIRSLSPMVAASCPANFGRIEQKLRQLGVITGFRYEGDQTPVTLAGDQRQPVGSTQAEARKGAQS